jgi:SAM-dependent methyltransferase
MPPRTILRMLASVASLPTRGGQIAASACPKPIGDQGAGLVSILGRGLGVQQAARSAGAYDSDVGEAPDYAFPHSAADESRRLRLLEQRLDPLTQRRIRRLGVGTGARCLEIGGGRGSITRWLSDVVGPAGRVIATDLQLGFLTEIGAPNVEVLRHDIRTDTFPPGSFDLIHTRAVLMHISPSVDLLRRMVTWLAPGGWLVLEEPDFGMWVGDSDPVWATSPPTTHLAFPGLALSQGRSLLRQIHQLGLTDVGADAEIDIIQAGTDLAEFYQLSQAALAVPKVQAGAQPRAGDRTHRPAGRR